MSDSFQHIGLIGKYGDPGVAETLQRVAAVLRQRQIRVSLDEATGAMLGQHDIETASRETLAADSDMVIVIGGDGTLLDAARSLARAEVPVLGINLGRLGFLVDVSPVGMEAQLNAILDGDYVSEQRSLLNIQVTRDGAILQESDALNDLVIHKVDIARMLELETHIDGKLLTSLRADGLIVSTPTGSTAYALSGGGPILHPSLDAIVLVPICPHTLSNRPIVVNEESRIQVRLLEERTQAQITCDGQVNFDLHTSDKVLIRKAAHSLHLIHPAGHDYYEVLRAKLGWGGNINKIR